MPQPRFVELYEGDAERYGLRWMSTGFPSAEEAQAVCDALNALERSRTAGHTTSDKDWITEAVPGGWRVVNRLNPQEAVRRPDDGFPVTIFATEAEAIALCNVLRTP